MKQFLLGSKGVGGVRERVGKKGGVGGRGE
jgi:hypothetical protein